MNLLTALAIGVLFGAGVYQMLRRSTLRAAMGLVLISNAINLFLFSAGAYDGIRQAYYDQPFNLISDPLPQALVLTAIVISMGGFAFTMSLIYTISQRQKHLDSDQITGLKN